MSSVDGPGKYAAHREYPIPCETNRVSDGLGGDLHPEADREPPRPVAVLTVSLARFGVIDRSHFASIALGSSDRRAQLGSRFRCNNTTHVFILLAAFPSKINPPDLLHTPFPLGFAPPLKLGGITGDVIL